MPDTGCPTFPAARVRVLRSRGTYWLVRPVSSWNQESSLRAWVEVEQVVVGQLVVVEAVTETDANGFGDHRQRRDAATDQEAYNSLVGGLADL